MEQYGALRRSTEQYRTVRGSMEQYKTIGGSKKQYGAERGSTDQNALVSRHISTCKTSQFTRLAENNLAVRTCHILSDRSGF
ncbi:hypothetical protein RRG08_001750 [Elysia crispata]|uniref:Uncharacterized protein n=1 Tax=Elysia crispata TaxID=231223 RepID=A0AAE1E0B9_9GAST|nr:hypothetical protein RRG08_001750 [Elysia crispata]